MILSTRLRGPTTLNAQVASSAGDVRASSPRAGGRAAGSAVQQGHVDLAQPVRIAEQLDPGDPPPRDGESEDHPRLAALRPDQAHGPIHQGQPGRPGPPGEGIALAAG